MVELRVLGPLEVVLDGEVVDIGRGRETALLLLLAMHAGAPVPTDRIVDDLWEEQPPENASKSVQIYVSRLRKTLGTGCIETTPAGYALRVRADELDVARFERLAARGRDELRREDAAAAERTLAAALALWRGDAFGDVRFASFVQEEIRRLEEMRAAAAADHADALLVLGRAEDAIPELRRLVASQPLWERPRQQLMLALYRCGNQTEALQVYRETRTILADELGLEPSAELLELERRILNQDPDLGGVRRLRTERSRRRRGAVFVLSAGAILVVAAVAVAVVASRGGGTSGTLTSIAPNSLAAIDARRDRLVAQIGLGSSPTAVAVGTKAIWVADAGRQQLVAIDPHRLRVVRTLPVASIPTDLAARGTALWATNPLGAEEGSLTEVDETAGTTRIVRIRHGFVADLFAPSTPNAVALSPDGAVWTDTVHERLVRVDRTGRRTFDIGSGRSIDGLTNGAGSIWIASSVDDTVVRFDPAVGRVAAVVRVSVHGRAAGPAAVAWGDRSLWVADALGDAVTRIDPRRNRVVATIRVGARPTAIAVGARGVWTVNAGSGSVTHIDPADNRVVSTIPVGHVLTGLAVGGDRVWVTVAGGRAAEPEQRPAAPARPLVTGSCDPLDSGAASPDLMIVSDLPRFDAGGKENPDVTDMVTAIRAVLRAHHFRAGPYALGFQACTDSEPRTSPDAPLCAANARAYAADPSVVGVIGAHQSFCTGLELPILNASPTGPVAMISPSNTYVGLTHEGLQTGPDEPDRYYPTGVRNYVRLAPADDGQGAALAELARQLHRHRIFPIADGDPTAAAMVAYVRRAAHHLGVGVAGTADWGPKGPYRALARRIRAAHADAVVITGCICTNGGELVRDLGRVLGRGVPLLASDNFTCQCDMSAPGTPREGYGMYISLAGTAPARLPPRGRKFLARVFHGRPLADIDTYVATAAAAAETLLHAIAASDGTRGDVVAHLTHDRVARTVVGPISFDANGDPARAPFTIFRVTPNAPRTPHIAVRGRIVDRIIDAEPALTAP